jgi:photosystem II stability/assembly factor-like uncharacterized protein
MNKHKRTYLILSVILLLGTFFTLGFSNITNNGNPDLIIQPLENGKPGFTNGVGWVVGDSVDDYGTILHTTDGGETWERQGSVKDIPDVDLHTVFAIDACNAWVVGNNANGYGVILRTTDGGQSWTRQGDPDQIPDVGTIGVYAINKRVAWVTGEKGVILHTNDGGETWTRQGADTAPPDIPLRGVYASDANHVWVVGDPSSGCNGTTCGTILHTKNGGRTWERQSYEPNPLSNRALIWVHGLNARTAWVVGNFTVLHTTDGGKTWQDITKEIVGREDFNGVFAVDKNTVWVTLDYNNLYKYDGSQWQQQTTPSIGGYYFLRISAINKNTAWFVGTGDSSGTFLTGAIFHTSNGGDSWEAQAYGKAIPELSGISFVKSGFCNPNR